MKTFLTVLLLGIVVISGCKKKSSAPDKTAGDIDANLQGTWYTTFQQSAYYNGSTEVNEESVKPGIKYVITGNEIKVTYLNKAVERGTYTISKINNTGFVTVTLGGSTETYEITSIDDKAMIWKQESSVQVNGANRKVITIEFHCPCR